MSSEKLKSIFPLLGGGGSCACTSKLQMRGWGSSRRVKLNLLLLAGEGWDEIDACCLFITPPAIVVRYTHTIASSPSKEGFVTHRDKVNILHDIYKNFLFFIFNFQFLTKNGGRKSLHFNLGIANTGLEVRCKSA